MTSRNFSGGVFAVPRNMRCSKKCAKPDLPGSTSLREPVCTGIWMLTRFGNPVGTTITFSPLASVRSVALNGRMSPLCASGAAGRDNATNINAVPKPRSRLFMCLFLIEPDVLEHAERLREVAPAGRQRDLVDARARGSAATPAAAAPAASSRGADAAAVGRTRGCGVGCARGSRCTGATARTTSAAAAASRAGAACARGRLDGQRPLEAREARLKAELLIGHAREHRLARGGIRDRDPRVGRRGLQQV